MAYNGTLYLIRGIPGSGKTTLAKEIAPDMNVSADDYFTTPGGGYRFDATKLSAAHEWCRGWVQTAMMSGTKRIAVHNTFSRRWELQPYLDLANEFNYRVTEIQLPHISHVNTHDVPEDTILAMLRRWEF